MNALKTIDHVAQLASRLVADESPLAAMFTRDYEADFTAGRGAAIRVRIPGALKANTRDVGSIEDYITGSLSEKTVPVELDHEAYASVVLSLADLDLNIEDLGAQVLAPMAETIGAHVEKTIADELAAVPNAEGVTYEAEAPEAAVIRARAQLRKNGLPAREPLNVLVGADVFAELSLAKALDENGRVAGIDVVESTSIDPRAMYVFSKRALAVVLRAPRPSESVKSSSTLAPNGAPLTTTHAWNAANGSETLTSSVFVGVAPFPLIVNDHATGTANEVTHGAIVSVDTTPTA